MAWPLPIPGAGGAQQRKHSLHAGARPRLMIDRRRVPFRILVDGGSRFLKPEHACPYLELQAGLTGSERGRSLPDRSIHQLCQPDM